MNTAFPFARSLYIVRDEDIEPRDDPANHGADSVLLGGSERPLEREGLKFDRILAILDYEVDHQRQIVTLFRAGISAC